MYFDTGLKAGNYIYLIEHISRCLISINLFSGNAKIEAYLPWKYKNEKIGMLLFEHNIFIYSPVIDHILTYNCLNRQISTIKLPEIESDETGAYFSNILIERDGFIVLPFKSKTIRKYGLDGKLKFKDNQWLFAIDKGYEKTKNLLGNIRRDSACIVGELLFFSLTYEGKNYLCRYELASNQHSCSIIYNSEDSPIRGVYTYSNMVLFRRLFVDKTEIVLVMIDSGEQKVIILDDSSFFEEDIFGDIYHLKGAFKNKILEIDVSNFKKNHKIYDFKQSDNYIAEGIIFNTLKNEIILLNMEHIRKYSIKKIAKEIKNSYAYLKGCEKLFNDKCIGEGKYSLYNFIEYITECIGLKRKKNIKNKTIGKLIWRISE